MPTNCEKGEMVKSLPLLWDGDDHPYGEVVERRICDGEEPEGNAQCTVRRDSRTRDPATER